MGEMDIDKTIIKGLSAESKKNLLQRFGALPKLPPLVESINDDGIYSTTDVAELLKFTPQHVRRLCKQDKIKSIQIGPKGTYKIFGRDIKDFCLKYLHCASLVSKLLLDE